MAQGEMLTARGAHGRRGAHAHTWAHLPCHLPLLAHLLSSIPTPSLDLNVATSSGKPSLTTSRVSRFLGSMLAKNGVLVRMQLAGMEGGGREGGGRDIWRPLLDWRFTAVLHCVSGSHHPGSVEMAASDCVTINEQMNE